MAKKEATTPPPRKEPGLITRLFSTMVGFVCWLIAALIMSIVIEWIGIAWFWPEQGQQHSRTMLHHEIRYLNQRVIQNNQSTSRAIYQTTVDINRWFQQLSDNRSFTQRLSSPINHNDGRLQMLYHRLYQRYQHYMMAALFITQLFFVRLAIILFSLPLFLLSGLVGMIDGLTERDLRRWGGGRESSNLYNIARKSIFPAFVIACVCYISLPVSIHPVWIMAPFSMIFGLATKVSFGRLKKYF